MADLSKLIDEAEFKLAMAKDEALDGDPGEAKNWAEGLRDTADSLVGELAKEAASHAE